MQLPNCISRECGRRIFAMRQAKSHCAKLVTSAITVHRHSRVNERTLHTGRFESPIQKEKKKEDYSIFLAQYRLNVLTI